MVVVLSLTVLTCFPTLSTNSEREGRRERQTEREERGEGRGKREERRKEKEERMCIKLLV